MQLDFDTLAYVRMLRAEGMQSMDAEAVVDSLSRISFKNIYSKTEVQQLMEDLVQKFVDANRESLEQYKRENNLIIKSMREENAQRVMQYERECKARSERDKERAERLAKFAKERALRYADEAKQRANESTSVLDRQLREIRADRRWLIGVIITSTFALAGYLSALIKMAH